MFATLALSFIWLVSDLPLNGRSHFRASPTEGPVASQGRCPTQALLGERPRRVSCCQLHATLTCHGLPLRSPPSLAALCANHSLCRAALETATVQPMPTPHSVCVCARARVRACAMFRWRRCSPRKARLDPFAPLVGRLSALLWCLGAAVIRMRLRHAACWLHVVWRMRSVGCACVLHGGPLHVGRRCSCGSSRCRWSS